MGWRNRAANLVKLLEHQAVCAEVGVWKGDFSASLLRHTKPKRLHLIDPWAFEENQPLAWYGGLAARSQADMDSIYDGVRARFEREIAEGTVVIDRAPSAEALRRLPDSGLDWIYIDGNHLYELSVRTWPRHSPNSAPGGIWPATTMGTPAGGKTAYAGPSTNSWARLRSRWWPTWAPNSSCADRPGSWKPMQSGQAATVRGVAVNDDDFDGASAKIRHFSGDSEWSIGRVGSIGGVQRPGSWGRHHGSSSSTSAPGLRRPGWFGLPRGGHRGRWYGFRGDSPAHRDLYLPVGKWGQADAVRLHGHGSDHRRRRQVSARGTSMLSTTMITWSNGKRTHENYTYVPSKQNTCAAKAKYTKVELVIEQGRVGPVGTTTKGMVNGAIRARVCVYDLTANRSTVFVVNQGKITI